MGGKAKNQVKSGAKTFSKAAPASKAFQPRPFDVQAQQAESTAAEADQDLLATYLQQRTIPRSAAGDGTAEEPSLPSESTAMDPGRIQRQLQQGEGKPLDSPTRARMEGVFGRSFSDVQVHTGEQAVQLSRQLDARAFTVGSDIAFNRGEHQPGSLYGDALLAHELAHVAQQDGAGTEAAMAKSDDNVSPLELDANLSAFNAVAQLWGKGKLEAANVMRNAMPRLRTGLSLRRCETAEEKQYKEGALQVLKASYEDYTDIKPGSVKLYKQKNFEGEWDKIYTSEGKSWADHVKPKHDNLEGFSHGGVNYINQDLMSPDTVAHEMIHHNSHKSWTDIAGFDLNEGVTEYLTAKAVKKAGEKFTVSYPSQLKIVLKLAKAIGGDVLLEKAYFSGEVTPLGLAVQKNCSGGWIPFLRAMRKGDLATATTLLEKK